MSVETVELLHSFLERDTFFFDSSMNTKLKRAAFVQNIIFF